MKTQFRRSCETTLVRWLAATLLLSLMLVMSPSPARSGRSSDPLLEVASLAPAIPPPVPERFRVVSYNLHGPLAERIDDVMDVLKNHEALQPASLLALQEVNRHHRYSGYKDMAREIARALQMHYAYAVENPYKDGGGERGLAILSRFPLSQVERVVLPHPGPSGRRRITLGATLHVGSERWRVYTLHLETRISVNERAHQITAVLDHANQYRDLPTVILGDFNTISDGAREKMFELMQAADFRPALPGDTMTFQRALIVRLKLDWIWVRQLSVVEARVEGDVKASDHRPVWADFHLRKQSE